MAVYRMRHTSKEGSTARRLRQEEAPCADRPGVGRGVEVTPAMRAIIVDTEAAARRTLKECCSKEPDLCVAAEYSDSAVALEVVRESAPDVLFLDIHLSPLAGLEFARALDPAASTNIVFVSAYDRFARDAFEVNAVDFLVKPFDDARFRHAVARIRRLVFRDRLAGRQLSLSDVVAQVEASAKGLIQPAARIAVESGGRIHFLNVEDVELVESDRNYVMLTAGREHFRARSTLEHAERAMTSQRMLRISRAKMLNLTHVRELGRTPRGDIIFLLACGLTVTTSERYRVGVRQQLNLMHLSGRKGG
jgi:two-component system, LytTR family, response regulator